VARAEGLHRGLFRGKAGSETLGRTMFRPAVGDLTVGEHPVQETIAVAGEHLFDPPNIHNVDTGDHSSTVGYFEFSGRKVAGSREIISNNIGRIPFLAFLFPNYADGLQ
jgi:hypothetical protein